jgi:hypothetical protein
MANLGDTLTTNQYLAENDGTTEQGIGNRDREADSLRE